MKMTARACLLATLGAALLVPGSAGAAVRDWQDSAQEAASKRRESGHNLPAREIERRVIPTMPGARYLGFEYIAEMNIYRLKFLRNGSVIWVDADGRSGRIVRRTGD